jgi:hypothetical protein
VMKWRFHRCFYFNAYAQRDDALRDLDASEDALESAGLSE